MRRGLSGGAEPQTRRRLLGYMCDPGLNKGLRSLMAACSMAIACLSGVHTALYRARGLRVSKRYEARERQADSSNRPGMVMYSWGRRNRENVGPKGRSDQDSWQVQPCPRVGDEECGHLWERSESARVGGAFSTWMYLYSKLCNC